ncbi:YkgJ family cysteine cluster protein [Klenkia sp. PcliD-1-E]|uniref:YkgJ family cysteine cluster protein n=1 Tax=Klenkia sp. PcliD-1-E TaxID=2954492 RepID=UPI0020968BA7|nr:YkgJ family cysteine cluster protein [Klenkia sp. PcliD-1-E]MCO7221547.1 YkgJ family cysteine cluster protein [Klenkia sp. PcliD-1-E]
MSRRNLQGRLQQLQELYGRLPTVACRGLCASSCEQHVEASDAETSAIAARGVDLQAPTTDGACPALRTNAFGQRRCSVHDSRPMICRLWGVAEAMPCPHGCTTTAAPLTDIETLEALLDSFQIGGSAQDIDGMRTLLRSAAVDPHAAQLLAGFLRGDRSQSAELAALLLAGRRRIRP